MLALPRPKVLARNGLPHTAWCWIALVAALVALVGPAARAQPAGGGWEPGVVETPRKPNAPAAAPAPAPPRNDAAPVPAPNTTVIQRGMDAKGMGAGAAIATGQVTLIALLTADGQRIDQGLIWRVFQEKSASDGKSRLVSTHRDAGPTLKLPAGDFLVNVAFGRANLTRKITVAAGSSGVEQFVLNAGGLRIAAVLESGGPAPANSVTYDILADERDQFGNRAKIMTGAKPNLIIRLNAGIYHIVSTYGDANASIRADVTVEAGKLTEATVAHSGAKVTFKLAQRAGGEAQSDATWSIQTVAGDVVKESVGALPSHTLAPGTYAVIAKSGGRAFRREFTVKAGDVAEVEVLMR